MLQLPKVFFDRGVSVRTAVPCGNFAEQIVAHDFGFHVPIMSSQNPRQQVPSNLHSYSSGTLMCHSVPLSLKSPLHRAFVCFVWEPLDTLTVDFSSSSRYRFLSRPP